ncbi:MAG: STAS domain-containing protein [Acidobacteria bacterium]|nr:MAG: STAS domain-containing protein [Acidobacteriota bacterium]
MLRITINDTVSEQRWLLQGRLAGTWAKELRSNWEKAKTGRQGRRLVVDLSDVTFIDESGAEVLGEMMKEEARFITCGMCTKYLIAKLARKTR